MYVILCQAAAESLDYIINTVSAEHDLTPLLGLLKIDGKLVLVGVPPEPFSLKAGNFIGGEKALTIEISSHFLRHLFRLQVNNTWIGTKQDVKSNMRFNFRFAI